MSTETKRRTPLAAVKAQVNGGPNLVLIHGEPGLGKSTFAAGFPGAIVVSPRGFGTDELNVASWPDPVETWSDLLEVPRRLVEEQHEHRTLVFDELDDLEPLVNAEACRRDGKAKIVQELGGGFDRWKGPVIDQWRLFLYELERLVRARKMAVVFVAHSVRRKRKDALTEAFDRWEPNLVEPAAQLLVSWCKDVLFAQEETIAVKRAGSGDGKNASFRGVSSGVRQLRTRYNAAYDAKSRHNLPDPLPLSYDAYAEAVASRQPQSAEELRAVIAAQLEEAGDEKLSEKVNALVKAAGDDAAKLQELQNRINVTLDQRRKKENGQ